MSALLVSPPGATDRAAQLVLAAERDRIARGLGLTTVHRLFGIGLRLQAVSLRQQDSTLSAELDRCMRELDHVIDDLRNLVFDFESRNGG